MKKSSFPASPIFLILGFALGVIFLIIGIMDLLHRNELSQPTSTASRQERTIYLVSGILWILAGIAFAGWSALIAWRLRKNSVSFHKLVPKNPEIDEYERELGIDPCEKQKADFLQIARDLRDQNPDPSRQNSAAFLRNDITSNRRSSFLRPSPEIDDIGSEAESEIIQPNVTSLNRRFSGASYNLNEAPTTPRRRQSLVFRTPIFTNNLNRQAPLVSESTNSLGINFSQNYLPRYTADPYYD